MKKLDNIFLALLSSLIIFLGGAIFILPQESFSDKENRTLAKAPVISSESVLNGKYFEAVGDFYSDQFPLRDKFTSLYALTELTLGKREINGIIYANKSTLVARPQNQDETGISEALKKLREFTNDSGYIYIPPSSAEVFADRLPKSIRRQVSAEFKQMTYYRTDHHWTTDSAYIAYCQICEQLKISAYDESFFDRVDVTDTFRGTSYARSCLPKWLIRPDTVTLYRYDGDEDIELFYHDTDEIRRGFYDISALESADKYRIFIGGNYAHVSVCSTGEKPTLLLVKDSFANSVVPFLARHFNIEMIDPRYCSRSYLAEQLSRTDVSEVIFLLSAETLSAIW